MHELSAPAFALLAAAGLAAGFVNTVAGAGSLLSLRALMILGVLPADANGTNRVPVAAQSLTAALAFRKHTRVGGALLAPTLVPSVLGAVIGAVLSTRVPDRVMNVLLIVVLFAVAVLGLRKAKAGGAPVAEGEAEEALRLSTWHSRIWLFASGFYGGFLQAGVGLLLLHALSNVAGLSMLRSNALKVTVVLVFSVAALGVFVATGHVRWLLAAPLSLGSVLGALLAVRFAVKLGETLKVAVVVVDFLVCVVLVGRALAQ
jgi:uncharacterized membrane protein YfcA